MKPAHAYAASFLPWLLALLWWLNRDTGMFAAMPSISLEAVLLIGVLLVLCWPTIRGGLASVWQRVRSNMPTEANPWSLSAILAGVVIGVLIGWFAARVDFTPSPTPRPDVVVPTPIETGPLSIFLIHEAKEKTPALARTITDLRAGTAADYLAKQKHTLLILDDDSKDANGEPSSVLKQWREKYSAVKLPVLLIVGKSGTVLHADTLKDGATADNIVELIRTKEGK